MQQDITTTRRQTALIGIGRLLKAAGYRFVAPTPLTYGRVLSRPAGSADPLKAAFGWNRPFQAGLLDREYLSLLKEGDLLESVPGDLLRTRVRFSSLDNLLFAHSGYPTDAPDAVFFGPDTYRFARAIQWLADSEPDFAPRAIIDIGAGSGAGGLYAATLFPSCRQTVLADISPNALAFAQANTAINGAVSTICRSDILKNVEVAGDLIISNPPYLVDAAKRAYRHGGGDWGCDLAVRIVREALGALAPQGRLLLYTGAPVVEGHDMFLAAVRPVLDRYVRDFRYEELDPDVFGEELENPPYDRADRIATVVLHVKGRDIIG